MLFFRCIMDSIWNYVWLIRRLFTQYNACFSQSQLNKPLVDTTLKQCQKSAPRSLKLELTWADKPDMDLSSCLPPFLCTSLSLNRLVL